MIRSIEKLRLEYGNTPLLEETLHADPIQQFIMWMNDAIKAKVMEPNGMTVATVTSAGRPSTRSALLKKVDAQGFCFFTSYSSRKAEHLRLCPYVSLCFWWKEIYREVDIEGSVKKMSRREAEEYFHKRPKGAQIAASASKQSAPLASRDELEESFRRLQKEYRGKEIPCPKDWGGYRVIPERIAFWQGRQNRLHDRILYVKENGDWLMSRLSP